MQRATGARRLVVEGRVQGVGFRPFVYRIAHEHGIRGWVLNGSGRVEIHAEGDPVSLRRFARALVEHAPPLARPRLVLDEDAAAGDFGQFTIRPSASEGVPEVHVPPDQFACEDCLRELSDPHDRRHRYPFINCTQCGPRYTLIRAMPYDRPNTTMADFELCPRCRAEYEAPLDRRFHAEPVACPVCGPQLHWRQGDVRLDASAALEACIDALRAGKIVAVRGVGGYHLMCDPRNDEAVARLRRRKHRPDKPLAVMVPQAGADGLDEARKLARIDTDQARALSDPGRPIVLVQVREDSDLSPGIAPGLDEIGLMLPYSPLHHLLLQGVGGPLVGTSGNISGEPVITGVDDAERRLRPIADAFLHHDRPICRPADDPVFRQVGDRVRPLRLGRGNAPMEIDLPRPIGVPTLAVGAFLKNAVALAWDRRAVISPHIGDLDSPRGREVFATVIDDLQRLYGVSAERVCCDAHPDYPNTRWARAGALPVEPVYHHEAHAAAVAGELGLQQPHLALAWDGTGLGRDGTIWGAELFLGVPGQWQRVGSLRPFRLPGADRASREGWRSALGACWEAGISWPEAPDGHALLRAAWDKRINAPLASSAGRLFDAAAALAGIRNQSTFEGQAPMELEALARRSGRFEPLTLPLSERDGLWLIDWAPLLPVLMDRARDVSHRAAVFHASLAAAIVAQVRCVAGSTVRDVSLSGGVFQNRIMATLVASGLRENGFHVHLPQQLPVNDAVICFGQIIEAAARDTHP